jgi:hypothetical protein
VLPALGRARGITLSAFDREQQVGLTGEPRRKSSVGPFESRTDAAPACSTRCSCATVGDGLQLHAETRGHHRGRRSQKNLGILELRSCRKAATIR